MHKHIILQKISNTQWHIPSQSGNHIPGYTVTKISSEFHDATCQERCVTCNNLCRHLYQCDPLCYDYANGHVCKHLHRIHSLSGDTSSEGNMVEDVDISMTTDDTLGINEDSEEEKRKPYHLPIKLSKITS